MNRIHIIEIDELHGKFSRTIPLNVEKRMTVFWGKNGCGKTAILDFLCDLNNPKSVEDRYKEFFIIYKSDESKSAKTFRLVNRAKVGGMMDWVDFNIKRSFDGDPRLKNAQSFDYDLLMEYLSNYIEKLEDVFPPGLGLTSAKSHASNGAKKMINIMMSLCYNWKSPPVLIFDNLGDGLHVDWQRRLLSDMQEIAAIKNLQIIAATHSPTLLSGHWDVGHELGGRWSIDVEPK